MRPCKQRNGSSDGGREEHRKSRCADVLMALRDWLLDSATGIEIDEVSDVVEQRGGGERIGLTRGAGVGCALQGVLKLTDSFAAVLILTLNGKKLCYII